MGPLARIREFLRETRAGATAIAAAAVTVMTLGAAALIVDHLWLVGQRDVLKSASDAAAVAATLELNRQLAMDPDIADEALAEALEITARRYVVLNLQYLSAERLDRALGTLVVELTADRGGGTVAVSAEADLGGTLFARNLPLLGAYAGPATMRTGSGAEQIKVPVEVVLALDVSKSMGRDLAGRPYPRHEDSRIGIVKAAARVLIDALGPSEDNQIAVGLVPWHLMVRLDDGARERWDRSGWAHYPSTRRYSAPYRAKPGHAAPPAVTDTLAPHPPEPWRGCLDEHRMTTPSGEAKWPAANGLGDPPSRLAFAQGFFPAFNEYSYACLPEPLPAGLDTQFCYTERQATGADASRQRTRTAQGACPASAPAMQPLTADRARLDNAIERLSGIGYGTYSTLGVLWAQRMLSPAWKGVWGGAVHPLDPQTDGDALRKVIVLLTDGEDNYCGDAPGACATSEVGIERREACAHAKAAGSEIFVVAAMPPDDVTGALAQSLRSCSSEADNPNGQYVFINNESADDLRGAFVEIANQLKKVRKLY